MNDNTIKTLVSDQLSVWKLAGDNFKALDCVQVRELTIDGLAVRLQFNPARMISSAARLNKEDIARRRCFLCTQNRPQEQEWIDFACNTGNCYNILVNPYPIFPEHLVIALDSHKDQTIMGRYEDMLDLAAALPQRTIFYNGPKSGASAPDHHHFQAAPSGIIPLENDVDAILGSEGCRLCLRADSGDDFAELYHYDKFTAGIFVITSNSPQSASAMFYRLLDCAGTPQGEPEPLFNLFTYCRNGEFRSIVVFRSRHRSHHYFSDGPDHLTMSPGCADMGGVFIVPVEEEYGKLTEQLLAEMIEEISISKEEDALIMDRMTREQPLLKVGVMSAEEIEFEIFADGKGLRKARFSDGKIDYDGLLYDELYFKAPQSSAMFAKPSFAVHGVTIGVNFHWQRQETQQFAGDLMIAVDGNRLRAINFIGVEDYLLSVISSEMSSSASEEFLKAHAVISRSWVMARMEADSDFIVPNEAFNLPRLVTWLYGSMEVAVHTGEEYMKWYDHDDHKTFDVCADDHCQRYQGLTRATGETVRRVIDATWGQVLTSDGKLCDARFSKCCGGRMERFSTCWQDKDYPYLQPLPDTPGHSLEGECFCNTRDKAILGQVLNDYDQETTDFYRWTEELDPLVLAGLMEKKFGVMTGQIKALEPLERGESGRICKLRIVGELKTVVVGKELEIRRILSETHLKSSAFDVEYVNNEGVNLGKDGEWTRIRLNGRGWGHGVGLCQIGAAVMASRGYTYHEILEHYYPNAALERWIRNIVTFTIV